MNEGVVPAEWEVSSTVNNYKGNDDALEQGNYRGLKQLEHVMKMVERIVEGFVRENVNIDDMQFGFMPGRGITDAIFLVKQLLEKYLGKRKSYILHLLTSRRLLIGYHEM